MISIATKLDKNDRLLYDDLCRSNHIAPRIEYITPKQVHLILSLRSRIQPEYNDAGKRVWKVEGKKKSGGNLTQRFAQSFFTP